MIHDAAFRDCSMRKAVLTTAILVTLAQWTANPAQNPRVKLEKHEEQNPSLARTKTLLSLVESRGPAAASEIKAALSDKDWYVRGEAALVLSRVDLNAAATELLPLLNDENWFVRDAALPGLSELADPTIAKSVRPFLSSLDAHMRASAASALGKIKDAGSADALIRLLEDEDE